MAFKNVKMTQEDKDFALRLELKDPHGKGLHRVKFDNDCYMTVDKECDVYLFCTGETTGEYAPLFYFTLVKECKFEIEFTAYRMVETERVVWKVADVCIFDDGTLGSQKSAYHLMMHALGAYGLDGCCTLEALQGAYLQGICNFSEATVTKHYLLVEKMCDGTIKPISKVLRY